MQHTALVDFQEAQWGVMMTISGIRTSLFFFFFALWLIFADFSWQRPTVYLLITVAV